MEIYECRLAELGRVGGGSFQLNLLGLRLVGTIAPKVA
jgi:hypothetical protein